MLKLAIDAHMVGERETGNEVYTLDLVQALLRLYPEHHYTLYCTHCADLKRLLPTAQRVELVPVPANPLRRIAGTIPRHIRASGAQMLHSSYIAPPRLACPSVVTVHDLSFTEHREWFSLRDRLVLSLLVPYSARRAGAVIAVSECTRRDLMVRYGIPDDRITVTHEGVDQRFRPTERAAAQGFVAREYRVYGDYLLALGNLQPRKNLVRLLEATHRLRASGAAVALVIAGQAGGQAAATLRAAQRLQLGEHVVFTGYVPDEHLPALYAGALAFVHPALYEGFGLPPLEAMACGVPVACSRAGALPEVVGDAALLFDPTDVDDIVQKLALLTGSPELRAELARKGLARAAGFSWDTTARQTMAVYEHVAALRGPA